MSLDSALSFAARRQWLATAASSFGVCWSRLAREATAAPTGEQSRVSPLAAKPPHFRPSAKRVIFLFMSGGPSQVDLFDFKPRLAKDSGAAIPYTLPATEATVGLDGTKLLGPISGFARRGESGLELSDLLPHLGQHADDICLLRAVQADSPNHPVAIRQIHTGNLFDVVPSMGAWLSYGLGTENPRLPSYVTILPAEGERNYGSAFLPAIHQGTPLQSVSAAPGQAPIRHLSDDSISTASQRRRIDFLQRLNRRQLERLGADQSMEGVQEAFELAFQMQAETPRLVDLSNETAETLAAYGINGGPTDQFGRQCLLARRFVESGVRFVQVSLTGWDHHGGIAARLRERCSVADKPTAALLADLKSRGLLDDTIVMWGGEFGRTPHAQNGDGREHNHHGFSLWLAGGGVRGGVAYGSTDEFGYHAVDGQVHINDLHATLLHLLGLDHTRLTFEHHGRPFRLTDVAGKVVREILR